MSSRWPFLDPRDLSVVTLKRIMEGQASVLYASHEWDGTWQFLDGEDCTAEDAALPTLGEMVAHDATLTELAALPHGFYAFRDDVSGPWEVEYAGDEGDEDGEEGEEEEG